MTILLNLKTFALSVIAILLILASGCTKQEMRIDKSKTDCPFDTTKLVDKDWYIFSPSSHASAYRIRWDSDGNWYPTGPYHCGPYTWIDCSTFTNLTTADSSVGTYSILSLENNYLKLKVIGHSVNSSYVGTIYEMDTVPH